MNTTLTPEQIASYRKDGFVSHPGFLSPDEVAELKEAILETIAAMGKNRIAGGAMKDSDDYYSKVFTQRLNLWRGNDTIKKYMMNPDLGRAVCQLAGVDAIRMWHDQALIKEPYGNPTAWHLDNPYWSFYSRQSISIWIALEPATLENGCMCFVPGSQELATFDNVRISQDIGALFKVYPAMAEIDPVPVPMQPGDCSFHNGLAAHGAGANMTRTRRIAMTCAFMPDGSTFNGQKNVLPEDYFNSLKEGDVLNNDDWNPIIYANGK